MHMIYSGVVHPPIIIFTEMFIYNNIQLHPCDTFLFEVKAWKICRPGKRLATHIHISNDPPVHFVIYLSAAHRLTMVSRVKRMVAQQPDYHNAAAILPPNHYAYIFNVPVHHLFNAKMIIGQTTCTDNSYGNFSNSLLKVFHKNRRDITVSVATDVSTRKCLLKRFLLRRLFIKIYGNCVPALLLSIYELRGK